MNRISHFEITLQLYFLLLLCAECLVCTKATIASIHHAWQKVGPPQIKSSNQTTQSESFRCERRTKMKRISTAKASVRSDDVPKITQAHFDRATYRMGSKKVAKAEWQAAAQKQLGKKRISIMLDAAIIEHFKTAAGERGYQTLINDTLRRAVEGEALMSQVRQVIQQELAAYKRD
jgi:uncharacterized protein (DUF4415 family)